MELKEKLFKKTLTMRDLKLIAYVTMLIDHIGAVIVIRMLQYYHMMSLPISYESLNTIYMVLRLIGRIAFPIFCYNIVEGYLKTKNFKKYILRMLIFAIVSEVPFDMALFETPFYWLYNNVIWNLLIGLICIFWSEKLARNNKLLEIAIFALGAALATVIKSDYYYFGVLFVYIFYASKGNDLSRNVAMTIATIWEITAPLALIPIQKYNGEKGMATGRWLYWFYPVHFLILYGIWLLIKSTIM